MPFALPGAATAPSIDDQARRRIASLGITEVVSSPLSPWQNPYVERVIGSIRRECLDHVIILNHRHLRRMLRAYLAYVSAQTFRVRNPIGCASRVPFADRSEPPLVAPTMCGPSFGEPQAQAAERRSRQIVSLPAVTIIRINS